MILLLLAVAVGGSGTWYYLHWRDHRTDKLIRAAALRYRIDPALVKAVVWQESRFNHTVRGSHGELGLMQVTEPAANEWAEAERVRTFLFEHLLSPATNIYAGTYYLSKLLRRYPHTDNPDAYALADYNAGRANVLRWVKGEGVTNSVAFLAQMDFPGTRRYVQNILARRVRYLPDFASQR